MIETDDEESGTDEINNRCTDEEEESKDSVYTSFDSDEVTLFYTRHRCLQCTRSSHYP